MKKVLFAIAALFVAAPAQASYLEACEFSATVEDLHRLPTLNASVQDYQTVVELNITAATDRGSHRASACERHLGKQLLNLGEAQVEAGQNLLLSYFYVNNRGPDGVMFSESWSIIEGVAGKLEYSCFQLDRSLPNYTMELRRMDNMPIGGGLRWNVYISEDDQQIVAEEGVRVRFLSDHQGGMERFLSGESFRIELGTDEDLGNGRIVAGADVEVFSPRLQKRMQCQKAE